jgi:heat shock protein HslJ/uncharacterized lipoprotein YbaY
MSRTLAAVLIALAALAGCASRAEPTGPQTISIKGSLTYRARIALPPATRAVVELTDTSVADGRVVAEQRMDLGGKQVPIPFVLTVDRSKLLDGKQYSVRGAFQVQGRATWVSDPVVITASAGEIDVGVLDMKPYTAQAFAADLECGDRKVTVGFVGDVMRLATGDRAFDMRPVASASGAKYEAVGDPSTTLWNKGDETIIVIKGQTYPPCTKSGSDAAMSFRATGNEPGWRLDIGEAAMTLLTNDGKTRIVTPTPTAKKTDGSRNYVAKSGGSDLAVTILDRPCVDTMTGMPHPSTVAVVFEAKTLNGCGGNPADLLKGGVWVVEDITGVRLVDHSRITLAFGADGRVSGMASCNRYGAEYALTGEGLTIAKGYTTRMACDPPLMNQEQVFLEVLSKVQRFELGPNGTLILHTADRRSITARRG